jgi:hypothetical protein
MIRFVDPRAQVATAMEAYTLAADFSDGPPPLGLLANGFPDSEAFLDEVGAVLAERLPGVVIKSWNKGNASMPASDQLLDGIASEVGAVIAAYGH